MKKSPMKKLVVTLKDGRKVERDLDDYAKKIPVGTPATDDAFLMPAQQLAVAGILVSGNAKYAEYAPSSMFEKIEIVFE